MYGGPEIFGIPKKDTKDQFAARYLADTGTNDAVNATNNFIDFRVKDYDDSSCVLGAGNGIQTVYDKTWRYICKASGRYDVRLSVKENSAVGNGNQLRGFIYVNGVNVSAMLYSIHWSANGDGVGVNGSDIIRCKAGDAISIVLFASPGTYLTGTATDNHITICRLGP
jgi:hypothetical protein